MTKKELIYELLQDGYPYSRDAIIRHCGCKPGTLSFLLAMVKRDLLEGQQEIICQYIHRRLHYRLMVAVNKKNSTGVTTPKRSKASTNS